MSDEFMRGASASLIKTMNEIDLILDGENLAEEGKLRQKLRDKLLVAMTDVTVDWLRHGFVGGHTIAARQYAKAGTFPVKIQIEVERNFPIRGVSPQTTSILLNSKLKKKDADLVAE